MRIGRVMGNVTLSQKMASLKPGALLLVNVLDAQALAGHEAQAPRASAMPDALVVYDPWGAGVGQLIGISEGGEALMPFYPERVPLDAYCACIVDQIELS